MRRDLTTGSRRRRRYCAAAPEPERKASRFEATLEVTLKNLALNLIASVIVAAAATGCANPPTTLGKVPARNNIVLKYGQTAAYAAVDKFSFLAAEVEYPATGGRHKINIGDFLLGEVLETVQGKEIGEVRLTEFKSQCNRSSVVFPHAICRTTWRINIVSRGMNIDVASSIPEIDIGPVRVRQDQFLLFPIVIGDDFFQGQIGPLLRAIADDISTKIGSAISK
jgi:hypothetical protein